MGLPVRIKTCREGPTLSPKGGDKDGAPTYNRSESQGWLWVVLSEGSMRSGFGVSLLTGLLLAVGGAFGQTAPSAQATAAPQAAAAAGAPAAAAKLEFDVASVRPSAPLDVQKMAADMQAGRMPKIGAHVEGLLAEYDYVSLKDLVAAAYKVKDYQITCPDWMGTARFDISARMPEGSSKDDVPKMLQALLADRFKVVIHRETKDHPVLALVVGKDGPKLKASPAPPAPVDPDAPLAKGEMKMDGPDGPVRVTTHADGTITENMGAKGTATIKMDGQMIHVNADTMTMSGFADMLTAVMQMGGGGGKPVVDMTDLKGNYQVTVDISMADMMAFARSQAQQMGLNMPQGAAGGGTAAGGGGTALAEASDPSGGSTVFKSVEGLGLKLESRKAPVEQIIVDSAEKTPTET